MMPWLVPLWSLHLESSSQVDRVKSWIVAMKYEQVNHNTRRQVFAIRSSGTPLRSPYVSVEEPTKGQVFNPFLTPKSHKAIGDLFNLHGEIQTSRSFSQQPWVTNQSRGMNLPQEHQRAQAKRETQGRSTSLRSSSSSSTPKISQEQAQGEEVGIQIFLCVLGLGFGLEWARESARGGTRSINTPSHEKSRYTQFCADLESLV